MRYIKLLLVFTFTISLFANYTLVLKNGQKMILKNKPDLSKKVIKIQSLNGKSYVFRKELIDLNLTEKANKKVKKSDIKKVEKKKTKLTSTKKNKVDKKENKNKKVLVVNDKNFIRTVEKSENKPNSKKKYESKITSDEESGEGKESKSYEITDNEGNTESYWKDKFKQNKVKINASEYKIKQMEILLSRMATAKLGSTDTMYIMQISTEMDKMNAKLEKEKANLETLKKEKEQLIQKAKRAGAMAGWYRDYE